MAIKKFYTKKGEDKRLHINSFSEKNYDLLIFFDESPNDFLENEMSTKQIIIDKINENAYKVKSPYTFDTLEKWLYYGNWTAIYPAKVDFPTIDTFRKKEDEVIKHMIDHEIEILIDSFHDDIDWNIFYKTIEQ